MVSKHDKLNEPFKILAGGINAELKKNMAVKKAYTSDFIGFSPTLYASFGGDCVPTSYPLFGLRGCY